jgi:D-glycero-D-manno-heptose 1,7-bisphosphate phosphatase
MARRCVFLDRDGVINRKAAPGDYIRTWKDFHFIPVIVDWIRLFNAMGTPVIVITNQRGVARGLIQPQELERIHQSMLSELARRGAIVDDILCCSHEENTCHCRKPQPGLILAAQQKWDIDLATSIVIGDSESDRLLAERCGMGFISVCDGTIVDVYEPLNKRHSTSVVV